MQAKPLAMLLVMLAGWINRQQQDMIDYLREENKILREKLGKRYLIHDRDPLFTREFAQILKAAGIQVVKTPKRSPNLNAYAERFV